MIYKYHPEMDKVIENIIENDLFVSMDDRKVNLSNNEKIWIANYPYAYAVAYEIHLANNNNKRCRPSRENILKFKKYLDSKTSAKSDEVVIFANKFKQASSNE